jgi:hypothetical protein
VVLLIISQVLFLLVLPGTIGSGALCAFKAVFQPQLCDACHGPVVPRCCNTACRAGPAGVCEAVYHVVCGCVLQEGGRGIVDLLFGRVSPSGRLPITWYRSKYTDTVSPLTLDMRPNDAQGHPGRSYRSAVTCMAVPDGGGSA